MPQIYQICGSYNSRPPCPACIDLDESYKVKKLIIPSSAKPAGDSQHYKDTIITNLKMQFEEKDKETIYTTISTSH